MYSKVVFIITRHMKRKHIATNTYIIKEVVKNIGPDPKYLDIKLAISKMVPLVATEKITLIVSTKVV